MGSGKTTSFDIAYKAGVSQATVSRALRNSPLVSKETRERVQRIARELNYHVDRRAAGLRSQQSNTLALLLFEDSSTGNSQINPFFLSMLGNITRAAALRDYDVLVSFQQLSENWHYEYQVSNRADGIILLGYGDYVSFTDKLARLIEENAHFIIWGATEPGLEGHAVGCENASGGAMATQHLLANGRRDIAFFGGITDQSPEFKRRYLGHVDTLHEHGIEANPRLQFDARSQETDGIAATTRLLATGQRFDAIFAASDLIAIGAIRALHKAGLKVPQDVSVVGFDDISAASYTTPSLTTIRQDTVEAANVLVDHLLRMINGQPADPVSIRPKLVVRGSCGARRS